MLHTVQLMRIMMDTSVENFVLKILKIITERNKMFIVPSRIFLVLHIQINGNMHEEVKLYRRSHTHTIHSFQLRTTYHLYYHLWQLIFNMPALIYVVLRDKAVDLMKIKEEHIDSVCENKY